MRYQQSGVELQLEARVATARVIRGGAQRTVNSASARRSVRRTRAALVARLDITSVKAQNKDALIYPIIYEAPRAATAPDAFPQMIFIAPPDLIDPPTRREAASIQPATVTPLVAEPPPQAAPPAANVQPALVNQSPPAQIPKAARQKLKLVEQSAALEAAVAAPRAVNDSSATLFAPYNNPGGHLSTAVPLLLILVLLLFIATYIFTIR